MKRIAKILSITLLLCIAATVFLPACIGGTPDTEGSVTVVVGKSDTYTEYTVRLDEVEITEGVLSLLKHLKETEGLELEYQDSIYGAYLTSAGNMEYDAAKGEYIAALTSVESDFDVSTMFFETDYKGVKLGLSGLGISSMQVKNGATYMITVATYEF